MEIQKLRIPTSFELKPKENVLWDVEYEDAGALWGLTVTDANKAYVYCNGETREYRLNAKPIKVEQEENWVVITIEDEMQYHFKFDEDTRTLFGDLYDKYGEFVDTFALYEFEDEE